MTIFMITCIVLLVLVCLLICVICCICSRMKNLSDKNAEIQMSAANARVTDQYDMEIRSNSTANLHKQPQSPVGPESIHVQVNDGVSPFNYNGSMDHVMS